MAVTTSGTVGAVWSNGAASEVHISHDFSRINSPMVIRLSSCAAVTCSHTRSSTVLSPSFVSRYPFSVSRRDSQSRDWSRSQAEKLEKASSRPGLCQESREFICEAKCGPTTTVQLDDRTAWKEGTVEIVSEHSSAVEAGSVQHDMGVMILLLAGAYLLVRLFDFLTTQKFLGQKLSRKLVHIISGLLFALSWPIFSMSPWARFIAAVVPISNGLRLLVYGLGILKDEGLVKSVSRGGDPRELLRGPLYYVVVLALSTILFWRNSPVGIIALAMMCGGDGIADIIGRKFGSVKLPYNSDKSWAGSIAMFLFGFLVSSGCLWYFSMLGFYSVEWGGAALRLAVVTLAATVVESLPITTRLDDNLTVPLTTVVLGTLLFPSR